MLTGVLPLRMGLLLRAFIVLLVSLLLSAFLPRRGRPEAGEHLVGPIERAGPAARRSRADR
jgi:hypothetical protein